MGCVYVYVRLCRNLFAAAQTFRVSASSPRSIFSFAKRSSFQIFFIFHFPSTSAQLHTSQNIHLFSIHLSPPLRRRHPVSILPLPAPQGSPRHKRCHQQVSRAGIFNEYNGYMHHAKQIVSQLPFLTRGYAKANF